MPHQSATSALIALRLAAGLGAWAAPRLITKGIDGRTDEVGSLPLMTRLFGIRDVGYGIGLLTSSGESRRPWLAVGVATDVADAAAIAVSLRGASRPVVAGQMGVALGAAAAGVFALVSA